MSCACDVNPWKCRMECKHLNKYKNCGHCHSCHFCICLKILNKENDNYIDKEIRCRANEHECLKSKFCLCPYCNEVEIIDDLCEAVGCLHTAVMKCPICKKLELKELRFCSADCFGKSWKKHKLEHEEVGLCISGCLNMAIMTCPICVDLGITKYLFCSKNCVGKSWNTHKTTHNSLPNGNYSKEA